jgi:deoxyribose-phosphate aldolase
VTRVSAPSRADVARTIDHTLLKPEAKAADVVALCQEAKALDVYAVCVSPTRVALAVATLRDLSSSIPVASVVGFPSGAHHAAIKAAEAERAITDGALEIDMVIDLGLAAQDDWTAVEDKIAQVRRATPAPVLLKVILETALLSPGQIINGCRASEAVGADFVKTSTGFHPAGGASLEAIRLMVDTVDGRLGVKASGGIRTAEAALDYLAAGATRLGLSASRAILDGVTG